ncbi:phospholipase/carboxylesterase [Chitinivorax tropicus]|uniref:Phospholipase/carboxylesterase n=1 Tax=Chitinivorax tropicus TaxID=714531 RepID=A0A840MTT6_9PROT|nr:carboxylesterase [Chitinivorax tropicus]MBB5019703.1 phospholipase/carboxylesterase [Chitinivorax tropicus]
MTQPTLPFVELGPATPHHTIIWLHGLGDDGHGFAPIVPELKLPADQAIRFVFPHAPMRAVTINGGYVMRAWYDILEIGDLSRKLDEANIVESVQAIHQLIDAEISRGVPPSRILLAGFSQGGLIALSAGLTYREPLAGLIALSTYWPDMQHPSLAPDPTHRAVPIFCAHGEVDTVVRPELGHAAFNRLRTAGYTATWHAYDMGHEVCWDEIHDLSAWIQARFADQT